MHVPGFLLYVQLATLRARDLSIERYFTHELIFLMWKVRKAMGITQNPKLFLSFSFYHSAHFFSFGIEISVNVVVDVAVLPTCGNMI